VTSGLTVSQGHFTGFSVLNGTSSTSTVSNSAIGSSSSPDTMIATAGGPTTSIQSTSSGISITAAPSFTTPTNAVVIGSGTGTGSGVLVGKGTSQKPSKYELTDLPTPRHRVDWWCYTN
jgi:hypothetical protein